MRFIKGVPELQTRFDAEEFIREARDILVQQGYHDEADTLVDREIVLDLARTEDANEALERTLGRAEEELTEVRGELENLKEALATECEALANRLVDLKSLAR